MCRGPCQTTDDFPLSLVVHKLDLARRVVTVLDKVTPGFNKARVKALYEMVETEMYLEFRGNLSRENERDISRTKDSTLRNIERLDTVVRVIERMDPDQVFEEVILAAAKNLSRVLQRIVEDIEHGSIDRDAWSRGSWTLIELWKMTR